MNSEDEDRIAAELVKDKEQVWHERMAMRGQQFSWVMTGASSVGLAGSLYLLFGLAPAMIALLGVPIAWYRFRLVKRDGVNVEHD